MTDRPAASSSRVLVVDTPAVAARWAAILQSAGHDISTTTSPRDAMVMLDDRPGGFDLIVIDFDRPGPESLAALRDLRERHRDVVPLVTTAFGQTVVAVAAIKLGAADYLVKPVADATLLKAVAAAAARRVLLEEIGRDEAAFNASENGALRASRYAAEWEGSSDGVSETLADALLEPERRIIRAALKAYAWNRSRTAAALGINRTTLYKKIKAFGLDEPDG